MRRRSWLPWAMIASVLGVVGLAYLDLRREQARALEDFSAEQSALAGAGAVALEARLDVALHDLAGVATAAPAAVEPALRGLMAPGRRYRSAALIDPGGAPLLDVDSPDGPSPASLPGFAEARRAAARLAREGGRPISLALQSGEGAGLRLFAGPAAAGAVVLAVDGDRLVEGVSRSRAPARLPLRWLVLDDGDRWMTWQPEPGRGAGARWRGRADAVSPDVAALLATMSAGETGARTLSRESAESLGLERRMAVAGYAPVRGAPGRPWSIAVVASAMNVRDRARIGAWRLAAATVLAGLLVGVFGWISLRQQRRALGLQEALHLAEATASLRERAEKIVEAIPLGVLALDARGAVTAVNPWLSERAAAPAAALASALPASEPAERAPIEEAVAEARATRKPVERASLTLHLGAGPSRDVDLYAVPLARPLADVDCFLILHDRTETRQLERNLVRAEKLATIGTLAAGVAHELGTPLGIISGRAEQLLARAVAGDANAEPLKKGLASILAQVEKVSTTIRQLLDFARARPVETVKISPAQALGSAQALLEHRFRQAKVALAVDAPVSLPTVAADPAQLEQVFVNLLMNAADACAPGGHVTAQASARGEGVVFEIADDGCGIAPEHLPQVLDPFFTTKKRGQGTGLGLSIAADIVKNHGGALEIESAVGRGTTVRVRLPRAGEERHG